MTRRALAVLLLAVLVAGCVGSLPPGGSADLADGERATVVRVIDGDTVEVRLASGEGETVRLLGVDAPEARGDTRPEAFEGVPDTEAGRRCLAEAAAEATAFVESEVGGGTVEVVVDEAADRRDRYGRLLAYVVYDDGLNLNHRLVEEGRARVYDTEFSQRDRFFDAEADARGDGRGLWRCREPEEGTGAPADTSLRIAEVRADAPGNDHENLNGEYVVFRNAGEEPLDLTGWTVRDEAGHVYRFPDEFVLPPNGTVALYSGSGTDAEGELYWDANGAVWNNDGDTVTVANESGAAVMRHEY